MKRPVPWLGDIPGLVLFALLSLAMTWPLILHLNDHVPSDLGDPLCTVWLLGRNVQALEDGSPFGQANIFYPQRNTVYYGDVLPVQTLLAWPIGSLTGNYVLAYNLLFLLSFFLCAAGMYALVRRLAQSRTAAVLSGLIFAFCVFRFAHLAHLELLFLPGSRFAFCICTGFSTAWPGLTSWPPLFFICSRSGAAPITALI